MYVFLICFMFQDDLKNPSFFERLHYSIGYLGGVCNIGPILTSSEKSFYFLNSIEGSIIYALNEKSEIDIGIGYGWAKIETYDEYNLRKMYFYIIVPFSDIGISIGGEFLFSKLYYIESYYQGGQMKELSVVSDGIGGGIFVRYLWKIKVSKDKNIEPFALLKASEYYEYHNNSPSGKNLMYPLLDYTEE